MVKKMNIIKEKWEKGKERNLRFWKGKLPAKAKSFNFSFPLHEYFGPMIGDKKKVSIVDIGSGVSSTTGSTWKGVEVDLHPCDIWADEYAKFYDLHKIKQHIEIEKQNMEALTYKDESFDIVHCANALDHCVDPFLALREMYRVCKPRGWIYLRHTPNEGERHRYGMQHQWNIQQEGSDCFIWNYKEKFHLSKCVGGFTTEKKIELLGEPVTIVSKLHRI